MWPYLIVLATAVTTTVAAATQTNSPSPLHFFQAERTLTVDHQQVIDLPAAKLGSALAVKVTGQGGGDLDCYLLINHRIVTKDESPADSCYLGLYVGTDEHIKLWVTNHGQYDTTYQVNVDQ